MTPNAAMTNTPTAVAILHGFDTDAPILYCSKIKDLERGRHNAHLERTCLPSLTAESQVVTLRSTESLVNHRSARGAAPGWPTATRRQSPLSLSIPTRGWEGWSCASAAVSARGPGATFDPLRWRIHLHGSCPS